MKKDLLQILGDRIRRSRESKALTQANLAEELGMTASAFSKIENGINNTPVKRLYQIAEVLGVDIVEFFSDANIVSEPREKTGAVSREEFIKGNQETINIVKLELAKFREAFSTKKEYYKLKNRSLKTPKKK